MTITSNPDDKYAFLFTGPTGTAAYITDIENVFTTLVEYYNYKPSQITVVCGSTDATPSVPGATFATISNATDLANEFTSFATNASGANKTSLLYFTGGGCPISGTEGALVINNASECGSAAVVDAAWLQTQLSSYTSGGHVNVVMQQSYSGSFASALLGSTLSWSFTSSCSGSENSYSDTSGGIFTQGWTQGLRLEQLPSGTVDAGKYADELGSTATESGNRTIAMAEAMKFGKEISDLAGLSGLSTPSYSDGGSPQYLGDPEFLIRDGVPYFESPDIYLMHPGYGGGPDDYYIIDPPGSTAPFNNTINVKVRNVGTHPVRAYSLAIEQFRSGVAAGEKHSAADVIPTGGILFPMDETAIDTVDDKAHVFELNTPFYSPATHTCVRAEAKLRFADIDYAWNPFVYDYEAQRNIDEMPFAPLTLEEFPIEVSQIKGKKGHLYTIQNTFENVRQFYVRFPEELAKNKDILDIEWLEVLDDAKAKRRPVPVEQEPFAHLPFLLEGGEKKTLLATVTMKSGFPADREIRLPFDIFAQGEWGAGIKQPVAVPAAVDVKVGQNFALIGGFTMVLKNAPATLTGVIMDRANKPAVNATLYLQTVNGLQGATIRTDEHGNYAFKDINPDTYVLRAEAGEWSSKQQTITLRGNITEEVSLKLSEATPIIGKPVKVILDKIRILNDRDPLWKGKGEIKFNCIVMPDNDTTRSQVTKLPSTGVYHVSDKAGKNDIQIGATIFDGIVKSKALSIGITGKEIDWFDPNDELARYHRTFSGDPSTWTGQYSPFDEYLDKEDVGEWQLWYRITSG